MFTRNVTALEVLRVSFLAYFPKPDFISSALAVKAITAAQLSMASDGVYSVTLDEAIEAMRLTAADMSVKYKETSLSVRFMIP
jgi:hypothetical protein